MPQSGSSQPSGSSKKVANSLVALSGAAVLAVYSAGFVRTRSAANRFELLAADRMPARSGYEKYRGSANGLPASAGDPGPIPTPMQPSGAEREMARRMKPPEPPPLAFSSSTTEPKANQPAAPATAEEPAPTASAPLAVAELKIEVPAPSQVSAPAPVPPPAPAAPVAVAPEAPARATWKDGTYYGWGTSRHGNIQAAVVIEGGRIASATIAQCRTRYSCSVIDKLPPEVAQRQSPDVDYVSGATQSANAFYYAVVEALAQAK